MLADISFLKKNIDVLDTKAAALIIGRRSRGFHDHPARKLLST